MPATLPDTALAIRMRRYGAPEVLVAERAPLLPLAADEVRLRTVAAAVNHTDLRIRSGDWPIRRADPFPYVPGVEVVGEIVEVGANLPQALLGQPALTMMQGLGGVRAERDGGYAAFVTVKHQAVAPLPAALAMETAAAFGLAGVTACQGLARLGPLQGRRVLVTGAAGGVGSAALGLARAQGARVTALVRSSAQGDQARAHGAADVVLAAPGASPELAPASFDGVLDTVGGGLFPTLVQALADGGRYAMVGAVGGGLVSFDAWNLIRPVTLTGYSTENLSGDDLRAVMAAVVPWLLDGSLQAPPWQRIRLGDAALAHALLERGGVSGRVLLQPD